MSSSNFSAEDRFNPVHCAQCRAHTPRADLDSYGMCPRCSREVKHSGSSQQARAPLPVDAPLPSAITESRATLPGIGFGAIGCVVWFLAIGLPAGVFINLFNIGPSHPIEPVARWLLIGSWVLVVGAFRETGREIYLAKQRAKTRQKARTVDLPDELRATPIERLGPVLKGKPLQLWATALTRDQGLVLVQLEQGSWGQGILLAPEKLVKVVREWESRMQRARTVGELAELGSAARVVTYKEASSALYQAPSTLDFATAGVCGTVYPISVGLKIPPAIADFLTALSLKVRAVRLPPPTIGVSNSRKIAMSLMAVFASAIPFFGAFVILMIAIMYPLGQAFQRKYAKQLGMRVDSSRIVWLCLALGAFLQVAFDIMIATST